MSFVCTSTKYLKTLTSCPSAFLVYHLPLAELAQKSCCATANISILQSEAFPKLSMALCVIDITSSEHVRNHCMLSPHCTVPLLTLDLILYVHKFSIIFAHTKSLFVFCNTILTNLLECPTVSILCKITLSCFNSLFHWWSIRGHG